MRSPSNCSILDSDRSSRASRVTQSMILSNFGAVVGLEGPTFTRNLTSASIGAWRLLPRRDSK
jgi:hypothetical protein